MHMEELEMIPQITKIALQSDCMDWEEIESKYWQYLQLWILYAETSIELKKKSGLLRESAVNACRVYGPYISDILHQVDEVINLFSMEKELRKARNRGDFPVPKLTPIGIKIENIKDKDRVLTHVDKEVEEMLKAIRTNEENYKREQEKAKNRDQQLGSKRQRQTNKSDFDFFTIVNSTPIRDSNTRIEQPAVHFDTNPVRNHYIPTSVTMKVNHYEPPANDSIHQGAVTVPGSQFTTATNTGTGRNEP